MDGSVRAPAGGVPGSCPHLSPAGDRLVYSVRFHGSFSQALDGSSPKPIGTFNAFGYVDGILSPDRAHLAFRTRAGDATTQLLQVLSLVDDTVATVLTTTDDLVGEAWSPDGDRLAVAHTRGGQVTIDLIES